jgi:hypothetical protein
MPEGGCEVRDLSQSKQIGSLSLRHGAWAALSLMAATMIGCNQLATTSGRIPESGPDPSYRDVVASYLKDNFKDHSSYGAFEISDPRWVHSFQGWNWLTCVRFLDRGQRRTYALFLDGSKIVDARYAVQTDQCGMQAYTTFEQMDQLDPIH